MGTFQKMALLEVHDTVDMRDFSRLADAYRSGKEKHKQEWTEIESDFVSVGTRPEKEGPTVPSDIQVAVAGGAVFAVSQAHDEDGATHDADFKSQQGTPTSLGSGTPLSCQQQATDNESDFSSAQKNFHIEDDAETAKDDNNLDEEQLVAQDDGGFDRRSKGEDAIPKKLSKVGQKVKRAKK